MNKSKLIKRALAGVLLAVMSFATTADAQFFASRQRADDPALHAFPMVGAPHPRKVEIAWNRFYDHAGHTAILTQLHEAFPDLTELYKIGESTGGRDMWILEVSAKNVGDVSRKPGMYIDGNIHGNEVQGAEVVSYTAWYLLHQYGRLDKVTELLDDNVFYLLPSINPDGRDRWFHNGGSSRTGIKPVDSDRDGLFDEDDTEDLNGDGSITQMRIKDPNGRYIPHPDYPDHMMIQVGPGEKGEYSLLGSEGIDNDGDGRFNEDGPGGYDGNRNWGWDWQPNHIQGGAIDYPFSLAESRNVADFFLSHPNIAAAQSFHNSGGMILRVPGREGIPMLAADDRVHQSIAAEGEKMLPFYRSMIIWRDLYTVWGGEVDWFYGGLGIISFSNELWTGSNLNKGSEGYDTPGFLTNVMLGDGIVKWEKYDHPFYGEIEIGGTKKTWGRVPPSFLLEEECHRNMAFTMHHADMMPKIGLKEVKQEKLSDTVTRVWVTVQNKRLIPTRSAQDTGNSISRPDLLTFEGRGLNVLTSGRVTDVYRKLAETQTHRPERHEIATISGYGETTIQFLVEGTGTAEIKLDSVKGGVRTTSITIER